MGRLVAIVLALASAGCGRLGFASGSDGRPTVDSDEATDAKSDAAPDAAPSSFDFTSFATCPGVLVLDGSTQCTGGNLELTPNQPGLASAVWFVQPIAITASTQIAITVEMQITGFNGDGIVVVIQADPRGTAAVGDPGGNLAYYMIMPSVGFEVDTFMNVMDPDSNHVGIDQDGNTTSTVTADPTFMLGNSTFWVWLDYDGPSTMLSAYISQSATKPAVPILAIADDLTRFAAPPYIGITSSTGGSSEQQDVLVWQLTVTP